MKNLFLKSQAFRSFFLPILIGVVAMFAFGTQAYAAPTPIWEANPSLCPQTDAQYPGVSCFPQNICGDDSGTPQCYNNSPLTAPVGAGNSSASPVGGLGGGYIIDCAAPKDGTAPYCDNSGAFWCNSDTSCYTTQHKQTTCNGGLWESAGGAAFSCGACLGGWGDCDAGVGCETLFGTRSWTGGTNSNYKTCAVPQCNPGYFDCGGVLPAGDICATQNSASCIGAGGLTGTMTCTLNPAGSCNNGDGNVYDCTCVVPKQNFQTATQAGYSSANPLLWGTQYGSGDVANLGTNALGTVFKINNNGTVELTPIAPPGGATTNQLYNIGGVLTWNGTPVGAGHLQNTDVGTNSTSFTLDRGDTGGIVSLIFGTTLNKILSYVPLSSWFNFNDNVNIAGNLTTTGTINGVSIGAYNQTMSLEPEYNNTTQYLPGADQGKMELLYDNASNLNYYKWTTTNVALQEMDVVARVLLPTGFTGWQATPFTFKYKTADGVAGNNVIDVQVLDTVGAPVTLTGATGLTNAAWTTASITFGAGAPTWTPGQPITIKVKMKALNVGAAYASTLDLNYTGK